MNPSSADAAFAELLERNYPRWFGIARAYAPSSEQEDLLQEIMLQIWKSLSKFAQQSHIDTWAYRVALNTSLAWKRSTRTRHQKLQMESADISQLVANQDSPQAETKILDEFLHSLSKIDRAVLLIHLDGIAESQATAIMGLTDGALRVRLHRIKKRFQEAYCATEADS